VFPDLLRVYAQKHGLTINAYCVMTQHVHLVAVPVSEQSLADALNPMRAGLVERAENYRWSTGSASLEIGDKNAVHAQPRRNSSPTAGLLIAGTSCPNGLLKTRPFPYENAKAMG